jgi:hypothetical protein
MLVEALYYKPEGRTSPDDVIKYFFFSLPNPSSRIMALGFAQSLTEMNARNIPGGKARPACEVDNLTAI